ncbi:MAG: N,N-dimethylformamidase beta subunit family domain-containing protein [Verrucomicrobiota bacterium]
MPGVHGYADAVSVRAGETLGLHFSSTVPYRVEILRLGTPVDDPAGDSLLHAFPETAASPQPIHPGSYIHVEKRLRVAPRAFTVEAWVRPWTLGRLQGVVSQEDKTSDDGFALGIGPGGYVGFFLGDGVGPDAAVVHRTRPGVVEKGKWHHLVASWDGRWKRVWVDGELAGEWSFAGPGRLGRHPLRLGAMGEEGRTTRLLDGDLAMVSLHEWAWDGARVAARRASRGLVAPGPEGMLACWTLSEERGERVADASGRGHHGRVINGGTWMIGGPSFRAEVPRFDGYDPARDPERGHGLRLASDDLYDCRWPASHRWRVPAGARPGVYVARAIHREGGRERVHVVTFVVRRAAKRKPAPVLVVCSTNTWRAYNGAPFGLWPDSKEAVLDTGGLPNAPGDPPAFCLYRSHAAGQGTYQLGSRMPWPSASPHALYGGPTRYSHLLRAERFLHAWLEAEGYDYDVAADLDLHRDPGLFRRHRVVILNGHSEYWSVPALEGLGEYLRGGGNLVVLSGNSLFWRVSFDETGTVMECRKVDAPGDQLPASRRGECWHSQDGRRGGLLRECGHPGWQLVGLETLGWNNPGEPRNFGPYVATGTGHFLFHQPGETGLRDGDLFGQGPDGGVPLANGHEFDVRLSTLRALQEQPDPPGSAVPPDPPGLVPLANGVIPWKFGGSAFDFFFRPIRPRTDQGGEMIYWERPDGGRVFHAGSIGSGWALSADPRFQVLIRNVLHHFGVPRPDRG